MPKCLELCNYCTFHCLLSQCCYEDNYTVYGNMVENEIENQPNLEDKPYLPNNLFKKPLSSLNVTCFSFPCNGSKEC